MQHAMNDDTSPGSFDPLIFSENMAKAGCIWQEIAQYTLSNQTDNIATQSIDPFFLRDAWVEMFDNVSQNPQKLAHIQAEMYQDYIKFWQHTTRKMLGQVQDDYIAADGKDRRFRDNAWDSSLIFDTLKQCYFMANKWTQNTLQELRPSDDHNAAKINFFTRHFLDAMAPTNFMNTNPEVIRTALETNGESIVSGFTNLLEDIKVSKGAFGIRTSDETAFELGKNIACTPGKVVFENDLMQLIQYKPLTEQVYKTPLLITPAWINKYYVLDLKPENSFVKWAIEQGHSVFIISWINPDASLTDKTFDDYMLQGPIAALGAIEAETGESQVNAVGYCLGGTLLAITLAYLQAKGQSSRIQSATFLTTLLDFSACGDIGVFIDNAQLDAMEARMSEAGYLDSHEMASTFSMLRANDMIWSFVVNNYLLGKAPFPFDLLYWNSDATRIPAAAHSFYLRNFYQKNNLIKPKAIVIDKTPIDLGQIVTPCYFLSAREDHIAPWQSTYAGVDLLGGEVTFTLADSGHVAGVINPPLKQKYSYWSNADSTGDADGWLKDSKETKGSWWPHWKNWITDFSGDKVAARALRKTKKRRENAPGRYAEIRT